MRRWPLFAAACRLSPDLMVVMLAWAFLASAALGAPAGDGLSPPPALPGTSAGAATHGAGPVNDLRAEDTFGVQALSPVGVALHQGGSLIQQAGARFVSLAIDWRVLAPLSTTESVAYDWAEYDAAISQTSALGLAVIVTLGGNPSWAASYSRGPVDCVPLGRWDEYVLSVVERYSNTVRYWAVYNEPDGTMGTDSVEPLCPGNPRDRSDFGAHPAAYVELLRRAHSIIEGVDPEAVVLFGGIAYDWFTTEPVAPGPFVRDFLGETLQLGAADYFDVMNFHYYYDTYFDARWTESGSPGLIGKAESIRSILRAHGIDKPLFCTELGTSSALSGETPDTQSGKLVQLYGRAIAAGIKVGIWYAMNDYESADDAFRFHGLLNADFTAKPSLAAYGNLSGKLSGYTYIRPLAPSEWGASQLEGYVFRIAAEGLETTIAWTTDGVSRTIPSPTGLYSVTDKYGVPRLLAAALELSGDPTFLLLHRTETYLPVLQKQVGPAAASGVSSPGGPIERQPGAIASRTS
jgi:hypothetical protein